VRKHIAIFINGELRPRGTVLAERLGPHSTMAMLLGALSLARTWHL